MKRLLHCLKGLYSFIFGSVLQFSKGRIILPRSFILGALLVLGNIAFVFAQSFPVQVIPQAIPPAPIYFSSYADASTSSSPLRVQVVLNDFTITNREVRLKAYFQGNGINFQSNDIVVGAPTLFLEGGIPLTLTNVELAPYFRFENITGLSPSVYGQAIPEGAYQFCFEIIDVLSGNRLSQKSCATTVIFQNEPPFLVSPYNKTNIEERNPQNIVFQWTPRQINVSNVEYELSIVEIWDTYLDPQAAFLSSPPIFQTSTTATTYVYGPSDPLFLSNKNYAWRVQAKAKQGTEEIGLFKNQGYSEIYSFSYAGVCSLPSAINHEVKGSTNANIFWDDFSTDVPEYTVRYRKKGNENEWFSNKTTSNTTTLWDLKAGTVYEYQVQKKCVVTQSDWSTVRQFTTFIADDEASVYECGITPDFSLDNTEPLPNITVGEQFTAGDFPIKILEVSGSDGRFTGKGYVTIPYLNSIRVGVEFTNVLINTDKQMAEGTVITIYDPTLSNIVDIDAAIDTVTDAVEALGEPFEGNNDLDEIRINWVLDPENDIKIVDGILIITNPQNGATETSPLGDDKVIVDGAGNVYHVDAGGTVTEGGQIDPAGSVTTGNVTGVSQDGELQALKAKGILVTFEDNGVYGYDQMPITNSEKLKKEYVTIPDADGNPYTLVHQAVAKEESIEVKAKVIISNSDYTLEDIIFKTKAGELIPSENRGGDLYLNLKGRYTLENETIYAVVPSKTEEDQQLTAGAFTLWHLTDRAVDVMLVAVDGVSIPQTTLETVQKIFKKGVATINLSTASASLDKNVLGEDGILEIGDSPWLANYNTEQKAVIENIKSQINYDPNVYYLLVFDSQIKTTKSIGGFMPLQRQFGFVFNGDLNASEEGKDDLATTIAHELGHGVFALQHPFTEYSSAQGATDWLMDYKDDASLLPHMHWAQMHNPDLKFYVFQDEEDGEIAGQIWFTPKWEPIKVKNAEVIYVGKVDPNHVNGTIPGFNLGNNTYYADYDASGNFNGYKSDLVGQYKDSTSIVTLKDTDEVYIFRNNGGCNKDTYHVITYEYYKNNKDKANFLSALSKGAVIGCEKDLCDKGQKFFDDYSYLIKNQSISDEAALKSIAELVCSDGPYSIDYDILVAQLSKDSNQVRSRFWWGSDKYLYDLARDKFWERPDALELYLYALKTIQNKISELNSLLNQKDATLEDYYSALYYLNDDFLQSLSVQDKIKIVKYILEKDTYITSKIFGFGQNEEHLLLKVVKAVGFDQKEAYDFLEELSNSELFDKLGSGLDDHLGENNFTEFIQHLAKLSEVAYANGDTTTKEPKHTFDWGIKNVDFILSWVKTIGDYNFGYSENQVWIRGLCSNSMSMVDNDMGGFDLDEQCQVDDKLHPFKDFVQITIIESVSLLPELCNNQQAQFCGKAIIVPAIFLEYLDVKKENQQLENLGYNTLTVAGLILTGGELAAAKAGSTVWYWAASDLAYTFSDPIAQSLKDEVASVFGDQAAEYIYLGWGAIEFVFAIKDFDDLSKIPYEDVVKTIASKNAIGDVEFYNLLRKGIKENNPNLSEVELDKYVEDSKNVLNEIEGKLSKELLVSEISKAKSLFVKWGKVIKGRKNLLLKPTIAGEFRQFTINLEGQTKKDYRAGTFWNKKGNSNLELVQYFSRDGNFYLKHDPNDGQILFFDATSGSERCLGFTIDQDNLFESVLNSDYDKLMETLKQHHGFKASYQLFLENGELILSSDKANAIFGKWNPNRIDGVSRQLGTDDVIRGLPIFKHYAFADDVFELRPGSIHMLNMPEGMYDPDTFFDDFNKDFLDMVIGNKNNVEIIFTTKPNHPDLFKAWDGKINGYRTNLETQLIEPSGFAKEIMYLRINGIKKVSLNDGSILDLESIDLDNIGLDWETNWK